ncbi:hypothetical protein [Arthrobacter sp. B3I4]|uniref:hypothetical protein n=1 Tax=Arthrobacter sp. B3I4 TaxID=3042267 RepID=UPI00277F4FD1|nr:hypothetical protein [Arthrobacter sp. B3I4]MDQ0757338.1 hypothetical protein [Arthrobacter sp. B3I4]
MASGRVTAGSPAMPAMQVSCMVARRTASVERRNKNYGDCNGAQRDEGGKSCQGEREAGHTLIIGPDVTLRAA